MRDNFYFFLNWVIIFSLICLGSVALALLGMFDRISGADVTKLSFFIYFIFMGFSIKVGISTYKLYSCSDLSPDYLEKRERNEEISWFISDILLTLGMIGTILGFIYMLGVSFATCDASNSAKLQDALKTMGLGMSTALYTTASGLICSILLKLQLFNFSKYIEKLGDKGEKKL